MLLNCKVKQKKYILSFIELTPAATKTTKPLTQPSSTSEPNDASTITTSSSAETTDIQDTTTLSKSTQNTISPITLPGDATLNDI